MEGFGSDILGWVGIFILVCTTIGFGLGWLVRSLVGG